MRIEVAYAEPRRQTLLSLEVAAGCTAGQAVEASGLLEAHPDIPWPGAALGIFSQRCGADRVLAEGDRVEIYRPLLIDPKQARRERAASRRG